MAESTEPGTVQTRDFASTQVERGAETAASAVAAQSKAVIESRYVMAMRNPRDLDQVRLDLLKECRRPSFAHNTSALYRKPIGKGIEGLGIRFVEVAVRCMRNILIESAMVFADDKREIHRVTVTDLETNTTYQMDVNVNRVVENSRPLDDGSYISVRMNSKGVPTYLVPANEDRLLNVRAALISKAVRTLGLRVIPGDLQDECEDIIRKIRLDKAATDPDAEKKAIADAFDALNVKVSDLQDYIGHPLDACTPAELVTLRGLWGALSEGEATWKTVMESVRAERGGPPTSKASEPAAGPQSATGKVSAAAAQTLKTARQSAPEVGGEVPQPEPVASPAAAPPQKPETATAASPGPGRPPKCPVCKKNNLKSIVERELNKCDECRIGETNAKREEEGTAVPSIESSLAPKESREDAGIQGLAKRYHNFCLLEKRGSESEAVIMLSELSSGKVQKFEDLPAHLRAFPDFMEKLFEAMK